MPYEFIPVTLGIVLLAIGLAFALAKRYLDGRNRMRLREMAHEELLKAMEKEVPLTEIREDMGVLGNGGHGQGNGKGLVWLRLSALCIGLSLFFGGIGMSLAFMIAWNDIWPMGILPMMVGFGLLLFYVLSRPVVAEAEHEQQRGG